MPGVRADTAPPTGTPETVSADRLPTWQINGVVWSQAVAGNTVFAGGSFTKARPPGVSAGGAGEVAAQNFFAYDVRTGNRSPASFAHSVNGQIEMVVASPDQSRVYIGGAFTSVDGVARAHIAAFDASTGALVSSFNPSLNGEVDAIAPTGSTVYVGGKFTKAGSLTRTRLAAFAASDGTLTTWAPTVDNVVQGMAVTPNGSGVVVGGRFTTLDGQSSPGMGSVDAASGTILPWLANQKIRDGGSACGITSIKTDGTLIYGSGFAFGCGNFEGTFGADPTTGALVFVNDCHGDTYDVAPVGQVLYSVSHAHDCRPINALPESNPRKTNMRHALAFTTFPTGVNSGPDAYGWDYRGVPDSTMLQWYPELTAGTYTGQSQAAWSVAGNADYVVLGGEFLTVNNTKQQGLVRFARRDLAPNQRGPVRAPNAPAPTAAVQNGNSVRVQWQSAYDMDNASLTYDIYRSGTSTPVGSVTASSNFWNYPTLGFTDSGVPGGSYTYTVRARDPLGNVLTLPATSSVSVAGGGNVAPTAVYTYTADGLTASFDASGSKDPDGTITDYRWDFGDGSIGTGVNPSHPYLTAGTYPVTLTVQDNAGATRQFTSQVTVSDPGDPGDPGVLASDTFGRTVTNGWGSADQGGSWALTGDATAFSVGSGVGTMNLAAAGATRTATLSGVSTTQGDTVVTLSPQKLASGPGAYVNIIGRSVAGTGSYRAQLTLKNTGSVALSLSKADGGSTTLVASKTVAGLTYAAGDSLSFRFRVTGSAPTTLQARVWRTGTTEPTTWQATTTDNTAGLQAPGSVGLIGSLSGTATNAPVAVTFDDLSVTQAN
jgi:PKD repeat protein